MRLGGICGAIGVFGNAWLIPKMGAGAFFMALLLGQIKPQPVQLVVNVKAEQSQHTLPVH